MLRFSICFVYYDLEQSTIIFGGTQNRSSPGWQQRQDLFHWNINQCHVGVIDWFARCDQGAPRFLTMIRESSRSDAPSVRQEPFQMFQSFQPFDRFAPFGRSITSPVQEVRD
jgi:hypothetical protein